jgi:hypothetical protein
MIKEVKLSDDVTVTIIYSDYDSGTKLAIVGQFKGDIMSNADLWIPKVRQE